MMVRGGSRAVLILAAALAAPVTACAPVRADTQNPSKADRLKEYEAVDLSKRVLMVEELKKLSVNELKLLRGVVFGKHGRVFDERFIQDWLKARPWYKPSARYKVTDLNDTERANMDAIKEAEFTKHDAVEPGDLKFFRDKLIKPAQLGEHTGTEWRIMRAEVEAIHGKTFPHEPEIQAFFDERYWYHRDPSYSPKSLSETERKNLATLATEHRKQRNVALSPGDMEYFKDRPLTEAMLAGLSLNELRLLRNEVYARHGQRFRQEWLAEHFGEYDWYRPEKNAREVKLSKTEERNVATIARVEQRIHEALRTEPVSTKVLDGMDVEDVKLLRLEVYARRGKVFGTKALQDYFGSFSWYRPDPAFKEARLTPVERKNARVILAYQRKLSDEIKTSAA